MDLARPIVSGTLILLLGLAVGADAGSPDASRAAPGAQPAARQTIRVEPVPRVGRRSTSPGDSGPGPFLVDRARRFGVAVRNVSGSRTKRYIVETTGSGAGWIDFDRDGRLDLYVTNGRRLAADASGPLRPSPASPNRLHRNLGEDGFEGVTAGVEDGGWAGGCAVADVDNDGFPDLYVSNLGPDVLFRNLGDGTFERHPGAVPAEPAWSASAAFTDVDGDGAADLYVSRYVDFDRENPPQPGSTGDCTFFGIPVMCGPRGLPGEPDRLLRNVGSFRFVPWQDDVVQSVRRYGLGVVPVDVEADGDPDLYVANDSVPNDLWVNDGTGELRQRGLESGVSVSGDGQEQAGMGVDVGDVDGDGLPDIFVTNFSHDRNTLYRNLGGGRFLDVSLGRGVAAPSLPMLGWAAKLVDVDNDGDLDLASFNGHVYPEVDAHDLGTNYRQPPQLLVNDGEGRFSTVNGAWRRDDDGDPEVRDREAASSRQAPSSRPSSRPRWSSRGAAFGDADNDGDVDAYVVNIDAPASYFVNETPRGAARPRHWLTVQLVGRSSNRDGLGARLTLESGGGRRVRWARTAGSYLSSNDPRVHFGLGRDEGVDRLEIAWPSGRIERLEDLPVDHRIVVVEGRGLVALERAPIPGDEDTGRVSGEPG